MSISREYVKWRGQQAEYTTDERQIMQQLTVREQAFVHTLKATMDGEIQEPVVTSGCGPTNTEREDRGLELNPVYTDPEELEFGPPKRRTKIYALVCTWRQSCVVPTKREGEFWMKVWKAWYEHQGWKVKTHDTGYFAAKGTERHAIGLDEYDRETKERIK